MWHVVSAEDPEQFQNFKAISFTSATDGWAVGEQLHAGIRTQALIEHWDGTSWAVVTVPFLDASVSLWGVDALTASDAWAVGNEAQEGQFVEQSVAMHWDGLAWTLVPTPELPESSFRDVWAAGSNDVWAVGREYPSSLIEHWDGSAWAVSPAPSADGFLTGIHGTATDDVWAVGSDGPPSSRDEAFVLHGDGSAWTKAAVPHSGTRDNALLDVWAGSTDDAWVVGTRENRVGDSKTMTEHWDGTEWSIVNSPSPGPGTTVATGVAGFAPDDVWAVGTNYGGSTYRPFIEHWNGSRWSLAPSPRLRLGGELRGIWASPSVGAWAVGSQDSLSRTLVESCA
jgi:hypothetical protein